MLFYVIQGPGGQAEYFWSRTSHVGSSFSRAYWYSIASCLAAYVNTHEGFNNLIVCGLI